MKILKQWSQFFSNYLSLSRSFPWLLFLVKIRSAAGCTFPMTQSLPIIITAETEETIFDKSWTRFCLFLLKSCSLFFAAVKVKDLGLEPWSSGYRRRLMWLRSWVQIPAPELDGDFFKLVCCKNCIFCLKRPKINKNWPRNGPFIKNIFGSGMNLNFLDHFFNWNSKNR